MMKLYAIDGVLCTVLTLTLTVLFLIPFKMGVTGYLLAIILADFVSIVFLFIVAKLYRDIERKEDIVLRKAMFRYALPLVPTTMCWWITSSSNMYLIAFFLGTGASGLFEMGIRIPTMMVTISSIFMQAWQVSAITGGEEGQQRFFARVFASYNALIFCATSVLILCSQVIMRVLVAPSFFEAWRFIPFLAIGTAFACMVTFFGTVYMMHKKSVPSMVTTLFGAIIIIIANFILIPMMGIMGAALATLVSYVLVFVIRAVDTRRFLKFEWSIGKMIINSGILIAQSLVMLLAVEYWVIWAIGLTVGILAINGKVLVESVTVALMRRKIIENN
jgi:O-antigen/teichoic acid export membrane protein